MVVLLRNSLACTANNQQFLYQLEKKCHLIRSHPLFYAGLRLANTTVDSRLRRCIVEWPCLVPAEITLSTAQKNPLLIKVKGTSLLHIFQRNNTSDCLGTTAACLVHSPRPLAFLKLWTSWRVCCVSPNRDYKNSISIRGRGFFFYFLPLLRIR